MSVNTNQYEFKSSSVTGNARLDSIKTMNAADKSQTELANVIGGKARRGNWRGGTGTITISPLPSNGIGQATMSRSNATMTSGTKTSLTSDANAVYDCYGDNTCKGGSKRRRHRKRKTHRKIKKSNKKSRRTRRR